MVSSDEVVTPRFAPAIARRLVDERAAFPYEAYRRMGLYMGLPVYFPGRLVVGCEESASEP
jgi:hypothetical protein